MTPPLETGFIGDQPVELGRYGRALKRNWLLMALIVIPLTALVLIISLLVSKTYRATARVVLASNSGLFQATDAETIKRELATIDTLATTRSVLSAAARHLGGESVETLERNVKASVDREANIINISATDRSPRGAAAMANAVALVYLDQRRSFERLQLTQDRANLIRTLERLRTSPGGAAQERAIEERLSEITINEASVGSDLQLAQAARAPSKPYSPRPIRNAIFAFFAGSFIAVLAALAREHFVRRLDGPRELSRLLRLPILSSVPLVRGARGRRRKRVRGVELEAYEALCASIEFQLPATKQRTVLVTSAVSGEGRSEATVRLGRALATAGHPTLLVDADVRRPALHEFFTAQPGLGFRGLLRAVHEGGAESVADLAGEELARGKVEEQLTVIMNGDRPTRPSRLLAGEGIEAMAIFDEFSRHPFEYILVDGPPLLGVVDAQILAQFVDAVLIVGRLDRLTVETVHDLQEVLERHAINALGLFVIGAQGLASSYYLGDREAVFEEA